MQHVFRRYNVIMDLKNQFIYYTADISPNNNPACVHPALPYTILLRKQ